MAPNMDLNRNVWHPSTFHDNYCLPQSIQWAVEDVQNKSQVSSECLQNQGLLFIPTHAIRVKEKWEWLGMHLKGPLPETRNGHKFVLVLMDYYSKWVEAFPMRTSCSEEVALTVCEIVSRVGFPVGILSYLKPSILTAINQALRNVLKLQSGELVFFQPHTGSLDQLSKSLMDRMVLDLVQEHQDCWDVCLPAAVFRLCCREHPSTRHRPLSLLHCAKESHLTATPRPLPVSPVQIRKSTFVILEAVPPSPVVHVQCSQCSEWTMVTRTSELKRLEEARLKDKMSAPTCVSCRVALESQRAGLQRETAVQMRAAEEKDGGRRRGKRRRKNGGNKIRTSSKRSLKKI